MAQKAQYNLWVLSATVFASAVMMGWSRLVLAKEWQVMQFFFVPILVTEWVAMGFFFVTRGRDSAMARYSVIFVLALSAVIVILAVTALAIMASR